MKIANYFLGRIYLEIKTKWNKKAIFYSHCFHQKAYNQDVLPFYLFFYLVPFLKLLRHTIELDVLLCLILACSLNIKIYRLYPNDLLCLILMHLPNTLVEKSMQKYIEHHANVVPLF